MKGAGNSGFSGLRWWQRSNSLTPLTPLDPLTPLS